MKLKTRLLIIAFAPILILSIIAGVIVGGALPEVKNDLQEKNLKNVAYLADMVLSGINGDYKVSAGRLSKGDMDQESLDLLLDRMVGGDDLDLMLFYGDTGYATTINDETGSRLTGAVADPLIYDNVITQGITVYDNSVELNGVKYYGFFIPLKNGDRNCGMIFAGRDKANADKLTNLIITGVAIVLLVYLILAALIAGRASMKVSKAVVANIEATDKLASGELNVVIDDKYLNRKDELGTLGQANEKLANILKGIVYDAKLCSDKLNDSVGHLNKVSSTTIDTIRGIKSAVAEISQASANQAADTGTASDNVVFISNALNSTVEETGRLIRNTDTMHEKSNDALAILNELKKINADADKAIRTIYEQTNNTNDTARAISENIELISNIANQTNLLSLNAAIEAARAGDAGQGFAVVASEISALSEQTNNAVMTIQQTINSLVEDSDRAVSTMRRVRSIITRQNENVDKTVGVFNKLDVTIDDTVSISEKIRTEVKSLERAKHIVESSLIKLAEVAGQNAEGTEKTSQSMDTVTTAVESVSDAASNIFRMSKKLEDTMAVFSYTEDYSSGKNEFERIAVESYAAAAEKKVEDSRTVFSKK
ncbi:MAG: methyl-accepting chemotaxis protein [Lachnospiraceae bacterium]|nr:methyl-accepting chemotaxis protein [Lachnospiraceae bacterium]